MSTLHEASQPVNPVVVENLPAVDLVRVEKSLHSLGFFASSATTGGNSRTVVQIIRRPDGQKIQAKAVIEGIQSLGLPTTADRDKYMAFMKIALDQRDQQGQLQNPVRFSGADMIKLLRLRKGGFHYDEINDWCKRMVATTIMSESSIFLADRKQFATDTFHVFDRVVLVGEQLHDGSRSEHYQVYLSYWQLTNLNQGYLLPLDLNAYLNLRRDIAKALFGHLSVWFYASRGQAVEKRYGDLCQLLHIREYPHFSKARSVLKPSLDELMDIGYLADWELARSSAQDRDFKLVLYPGKRLLSLDQFAAAVSPDVRAALESSLPEWVPVLIERGVAERKARQLALEVPDSQPVLDQIEYAEFLIHQDLRKRQKISNPAGFLVWVIEANLGVPTAFLTTRRKKLREAQQQAQNQQELERVQRELEYEEFCEAEVRKRLDADYPGEAWNAALREQLDLIRAAQPAWFERVSEPQRNEVAIGRLQRIVRERMELPSFEAWSKQDLQRRLF